MADRPVDTRQSRADNSVLIGVVLAAVFAILLIMARACSILLKRART